MEKHTIFISHITEEQDLALKLKDMLETKFSRLINIFVSSDVSSNPLGSNWLDNITGALEKCTIAIIITSHNSITRPWINFEAGACWIRGIPTIPLCHSGMEPSQLPLPFKLLQAMNIKNSEDICSLFRAIADDIGSIIPTTDGIDEFLGYVADFESKYTFWDQCNSKFKELVGYVPDLLECIRTGVSSKTRLKGRICDDVELLMETYFMPNNMMMMERHGNGMTPGGEFVDCFFSPLSKLIDIRNDSHFIYNRPL